MNAFWIILTGSLVASSCALPGCFLVLRRQSLMGDAIAHAILPGIVLSYLLAGKNSWALWTGAVMFGVFATFLMDWLRQKARMQADTAIGIVFTFLFAVGIILIAMFAGNADLDQECVLYGEIAYVPLETRWLGIPLTIWKHLLLLSIIGTIIIVFYKQFFITTFDSEFASLSGFHVDAWHYLLMSLVSLVTVVSFESVGAILVISFLVIPPAIAFLVSHHLSSMIWIAMVVSIPIAAGGYALAMALNASIAGSMSVVAGILLGIVWLVEYLKNKLN